MDIAIGTPLTGLAAFTNSMGVRGRDRFQLISAKEQTKEEMLKCLSQKRNKIKQNTQLC